MPTIREPPSEGMKQPCLMRIPGCEGTQGPGPHGHRGVGRLPLQPQPWEAEYGWPATLWRSSTKTPVMGSQASLVATVSCAWMCPEHWVDQEEWRAEFSGPREGRMGMDPGLPCLVLSEGFGQCPGIQ